MLVKGIGADMNIPYDLNNPEKTYELSKKYREISGICTLQNPNYLAFVQDEAIQVYLFNLSSEEITKYSKHKRGDSEDIEILGNTAYILTAGKRPSIYKVTDYMSGSIKYDRYDLNLNSKYNPEGLCYDVKGNRLLVACKSSPINDDTKRKIFSFDIQAGKRDKLPAFTIDCNDFLDAGGDTFNPSGIAIHPKTNDIYLISTEGVKMIVHYGWDGSLKGAKRLDKDRFKQPEGITFLDSGDLLISSEGKDGKKAGISMFSHIS